MKLTDICIRRPVLATVLSLILLLVGVVTFDRLQVRHFPRVDQPKISIITQYEGASPDIIETQVTKPLEDALSGIEGIDTMTSSSEIEESRIILTFHLDRPIDVTLNDVRDRIGRAKARFPSDVGEPRIKKADADAEPILHIVLFSDRHKPKDMADYAQRNIESQVEVVNGVSSAEVMGGGEYQMHIRLNPARLTAYRLSVDDIVSALKQQNIEKPAGRLTTATREIVVTTTASLKTEEDFNNLIIREQDGYLIRLSDLGTATLDAIDRHFRVRYNGQDAIAISVLKQSVANPLSIAKDIYKLVPRIQQNLPAGMKIEIANDKTIFIDKSINEVYWTILEASILVILVILVFLRSIRAALIPIVTIPLSLVGVCSLMYALGFSVNVLTLLALVMAIGLVVDDAIVMLENIYRYVEKGMNPVAAAFKGAKEISFAILAMTVTLAAVYAPISLSTGMTGRLFTEFAITLAGAVILSGFIALTLSPMMCSRLLKSHDKGGKDRWFLQTFPWMQKADVWIGTFLDDLDRNYAKYLSLALSSQAPLYTKVKGYYVSVLTALAVVFGVLAIGAFWRGLSHEGITFLWNFGFNKTAFLFLTLAGVSAYYMVRYHAFRFMVPSWMAVLGSGVAIALLGWLTFEIGLDSELAPPEDQGNVRTRAFAPQGASLEYVDKYNRQLDGILDNVPEVTKTLSIVQVPGDSLTYNFLVPWDKRSRSSLEIAQSLRPDLNNITGVRVGVVGRGRSLVSSVTGKPIEVVLQTSKPYEELIKIAESYMSALSKVPGVVRNQVEADFGDEEQEYAVTIDREKVVQSGLEVASVAAALETLFGERPVSSFRLENRKRNVVVGLPEEMRRTPEDIKSLYMRSQKGKQEVMVPLAEIVKLSKRVKPTEIRHFDTLRAITVNAELEPGYGLGEVLEKASKVAQRVLPEGTKIDYAGESRRFLEEGSNIYLIFVLAMLFIYLVLAAQYESFIDPFIIMLSVPLSLAGGVFMLKIIDWLVAINVPGLSAVSINIYSQIGLVTLIGLITKHGILIVDFANKLKEEGKDRLTAVVEASRLRLRPILMTTLAMVLGALPLALAGGAGFESRQQIGWVIVGGMSFGTLFTLFVVPAVYVLLSRKTATALVSAEDFSPAPKSSPKSSGPRKKT